MNLDSKRKLALDCFKVPRHFLKPCIQNIFHNETNNTIVRLKFLVSGKEFFCIGKIDTGCSVIEPFSNAPVKIVEKSIINIDGVRIIPYSALGTKGLLKGIKAEKIEIDNQIIEKDVYIGIFNGKIDNNVKAIINSEILR